MAGQPGNSANAVRSAGTVDRHPVSSPLPYTEDLAPARSLLERAGPAIPAALYLIAAALLLFNIGDHPAFLYNWESYTAWGVLAFWDHPSTAIFNLTMGLMTDSGGSPLVALPVWLAFKVAGLGLTSMRVPVALLAALAVPLAWTTGKRLVGTGAALLGASLLAVSPVFLLYGRTATLVGISLVPALLTVYFLLRVTGEPHRLPWLVALQVMLALDAYAYAPIRILWPLSLLLLGIEVAFGRGRRAALLLAFGVTAFMLPAFLTLAGADVAHNPVTAVENYYYARGEQVSSLEGDGDLLTRFIRPTSKEAVTGGPRGTPRELLARLIEQNLGDYLALLLDVDTRPTLTDFWNQHGRLYPWLLVPFFVLGLVRSLWRAGRHMEDRALLVLFFGFGLPLVFTSQVHVGRLIFAVPFLFLVVGAGFTGTVAWVARRFAGIEPDMHQYGPAIALPALALLAALAWIAWSDYAIAIPPPSEARTEALLRQDAPLLAKEGKSAALVFASADPPLLEVIEVTSYRLDLDRLYRFVDLSKPAPTQAGTPAATSPTLYYGDVLQRLAAPGMPGRCANIYYVDPAVLDDYRSAITSPVDPCPKPPEMRLLPR